MATQPLVSCLMVTRNRAKLAQRAVRCLAQQTWENKELVIIDDGSEDYEPVLTPWRERVPIHYHRIEERPGVLVGGLRNISLDHANGEFCIQWDDDEWYHPERIEAQMRFLQEHRLDAVVLRWTLMHLDRPKYVEHVYRAGMRRGTPGTILHRQVNIRYPNGEKGEDSVFRERLDENLRLGVMNAGSSHLFIRCFHGANTWDEQHFTERLCDTWLDTLNYLKVKYVQQNIFRHPAFLLDPPEKSAVESFLRESRELGLFEN